MNINLGPTPEPNFGETMESVQDEIDEHRDIMARSGEETTGPVMLLSDPEYPGAYRVWLRRDDGPYMGVLPAVWLWVTPDGVVVRSEKPWAVTA